MDENIAQPPSLLFVCAHCGRPAFAQPEFLDRLIFHQECIKKYQTKQVKKTAEPSQKKNRPKVLISIAKNSKDEDIIVIDAPFSPKLNAKFIKYHFIKWNKTTHRREFKASKINSMISSLLLEKFPDEFQDHSWEFTPEARARLEIDLISSEEAENKFKEINKIKRDYSTDIDVSHLKVVPYAYQKAGIAFLEKVNGIGFIGDDLGLGKTLQAIGYVAKHDFKTIVVCPASLKYNWKNEVTKFSFKTAEVLEPDNFELALKADFVITNYEQLNKWERLIKKIKWDCVILDESHYISSSTADRTKKVFHLFRKVPHRIELSGTPVRNRTIEFFPQLKFLHPKEFSNKNDFGMSYCDPKIGFSGYYEFKGASNIEELSRRISPFYIRRLKKEVQLDLPEKQINETIFSLSESERREYRALTEELTAYNDEVSWSRLQHVTERHRANLTKLSQFCSKTKVSHIKDFVKRFIDNDETGERKIIIFAHYKETQRALKAAFPEAAYLFSDLSAKARQEQIDRFQNDPNVRIFLGSTKAAGTGTTLTVADTILFADLLWTPAELKQGEDRAHRIGAKHETLFIYYFIFKNTIEEIIWNVLGSRLILTEQVTKDIGAPIDEGQIVKDILNRMTKKD